MVFLRSPGCKFVNRGDSADVDFTMPFWIIDSAYHDLDLSTIIPINTVAVLARLLINCTFNTGYVKFRTKGQTNDYNRTRLRMQVASVMNEADIWLLPNSARLCEYYVQNVGTWSEIGLTIRGWIVKG